MDRLLNIKEAAFVLNTKEWTLRQWCSQGRIPFFRIAGRQVRFSEKEIVEWVEHWRVGMTDWET